MSAEPAISAPVWARRLPWRIDGMGKEAGALSTLFGEDLHFMQRGHFMVAFTAGRVCDCLRCDRDVDRVIDVADSQRDHLPESRMYWCPECNDKRCERAHDHRMPCDKTLGDLLAVNPHG